jgi:hypothetical protein
VSLPVNPEIKAAGTAVSQIMKVKQSDLIKRTAKKEAKLPRSFPIGINWKILSVQSILLGKSENP